MNNPHKDLEDIEYIENTDKSWTTAYNHQKRPDQDLRLREVVPYNRIANKGSKAFTTDISIAGSKFKAKNEK